MAGEGEGAGEGGKEKGKGKGGRGTPVLLFSHFEPVRIRKDGLLWMDMDYCVIISFR